MLNEFEVKTEIIGSYGLSIIPLQISARELEHMEKYPNAKIISLGIGDTTQPIPDIVAHTMSDVSFTSNTFNTYFASKSIKNCLKG